MDIKLPYMYIISYNPAECNMKKQKYYKMCVSKLYTYYRSARVM